MFNGLLLCTDKTALLQGCGSVLATQNLDSISFEYSTQQRSSSSQAFIKPRLIARPAHSLLPNMPQLETPQQTCCEEEQGVQSDGGLQVSDGHPNEHPCRQQSKSVDGHNSGQPSGQPSRQLDGQPNGPPSRHLHGQANGQPSQHDGSPPATEQAGLHGDISQTRSNTDSGAVCSDREEACVLQTCGTADHTKQLPQVRAPKSALQPHHMSSDCREPFGQCRNVEEALLQWLQQLHLRYFTPREVANLHSFPSSFSFPPHVTMKQQYALLGNSLSVAVVADLLTYLLTP